MPHTILLYANRMVAATAEMNVQIHKKDISSMTKDVYFTFIEITFSQTQPVLTFEQMKKPSLSIYYGFYSQICWVVNNSIIKELITDKQCLLKIASTQTTDLNNYLASKWLIFKCPSRDFSNVNDMGALFKRISSFKQNNGL